MNQIGLQKNAREAASVAEVDVAPAPPAASDGGRAAGLRAAVRNAPEKVSPKQRFGFHVTHLRRLDGILTDGLLPGAGSQFNGGYTGHSRGRVFLAEWDGVSFWMSKMEDIAHCESDFDDVNAFGWMPVVLRVDLKALGKDLFMDELGTRDSSSDAWFLEESIAPEAISLWDGKRWRPLEDVDPDVLEEQARQAARFESDGEESPEGDPDAGDEPASGWWELEFDLFAPAMADATGLPAFNAWFEGSRVVDGQGRPLLVYHGSDAEFQVFEPGHENGWSQPRQGFYFTDDLEMATEFGEPKGYYLALRNPADLRYNDDHLQRIVEAMDEAERASYLGRRLYPLACEGKLQTAPFLEAARRAGFDGLILDDRLGNARGFDSYVAFEPTQIKSADDNCGAFDPANPDVLA